MTESKSPTLVGRYALYDEIASGGMATVHFGELVGPVGFSRTVAIKRLHGNYAKDKSFVAMFVDEARLAARIHHPNVVQTLDVVTSQGELFVVMEYIHGESLDSLIARAHAAGERIPPRVAVAIVVAALHGLHAAHETLGPNGERLNLVHRDVSPQNILVDATGIARVIDFGVAKAAGRIQTTAEGQVKGKISYMAPEQFRGETVTTSVDTFGAAVVLWEMLTGTRLFDGENQGQIVNKALSLVVEAPSRVVNDLEPHWDSAVLRALSRNVKKRFPSAREMALELENAAPIATSSEIGAWVTRLAGEALNQRAAHVTEIQKASHDDSPERSRIFRELSGVTAAPTVDVPTQPAADVQRPRRRAAVVIVGGAVIALLSLVAYFRFRSPPAEPVLTVSALPSAVSERVPVASDSAMVQPPREVPSAPPSPSPGTIIKDPVRGRLPKTKCNPPYLIDAHGDKKYKLECL